VDEDQLTRRYAQKSMAGGWIDHEGSDSRKGLRGIRISITRTE
jgi:hypothetical protein